MALGMFTVQVIWHNCAKIGPNMGMAAPVGAGSSRPLQKFGHGPLRDPPESERLESVFQCRVSASVSMSFWIF